MSPRTIFLFDVDGTLVVNSGTTHLRATIDALSTLYGVRPALRTMGNAHYVDDHLIDGLTIAAICLLILEDAGMDESAVRAALPALATESAQAYLRLLHNGAHAGDVIPGVPETLATLRATGAPMGLLTGGSRDVVAEKLARVGLSEYFTFGGFGELTFDRSELFGEALAASGVDNAGARLVYVGDTGHDVDAGHRCGAVVIGVASGAQTADELRAAGADAVFNDLAAARTMLLSYSS